VHPQKDEDAAGHADGQAQQIRGGESLVAEKVAPGYLKIVFEHMDERLLAFRSESGADLLDIDP
jgi:hypothetical protein